MAFDIITFGELLIDFTGSGKSTQDNLLFEANPGGSVANCIAMATNLGRKCAFIGKVGDDFLGRILRDTLDELGINTDYLLFDEIVPTTLAFVHTKDGGDREFSFYRNPGADTMLRPADIPVNAIKNSKFVHYASLSMTDEELFEATVLGVETAKKAGVPISFDPNYRPPLWSSKENAKKKMLYGIKNCDMLKISDDEILFISGKDDIDSGMEYILSETSAKIVFATLGADGSIAYYKGKRIYANPFRLNNTIETTGAGDTFTGCMIDAMISSNGIDNLSEEYIKESLTFANAAAALITTKKGALRVMPRRAEIEELIKR